MVTAGIARALALVNGRVYTADARGNRAGAVGLLGERIAVVGTDEEVLRALPDAERLDLGGRTVLPGFIDAHNHFLATGESLGWVDVRYPGVGSVDDLVAAIAEAAQRTPEGEWIRAFGFDHAKYERTPTRWDLDRAAPAHPVAVLHVSGHHVLVNSLALAARGVDEDTPDPEGGCLVRDERGRITGLCLDAACQLVQPAAVDIGSHGPNFHIEAPLPELVAAVERAGRAYLAAGLTTVCDAQVTARELGAYREARRLGRLPVRTVCMPLSHQLEAYAAIGLAGPFGDDGLWIGPLKLYADGSLIGGTAAFFEPYGERGELTGSLYHAPERLHELIVRAHALGWRVGVHTQGDRAMELVLRAFEAAQRDHPREDPRFRIEHAGYPTPEQVRRMAELGVVTVNQPSYLVDSGDEFLPRLGERAHRLQPLREELEAGVRVVLSSDSDVASYRPLDTIAAAVSRRTLAGRPIGADQALSVEEAIRAHTVEAAFAIGAEDRLGSIEPGKLADLVVLDGDPFTEPPERIRELRVWMTILGGEPVFTAEG
jgi:predicted amidohydrolase YtcJ